MYPPSLIALACLNLACVIQKKDAKQWFSELNVDIEKVLFLFQTLKCSYLFFEFHLQKGLRNHSTFAVFVRLMEDV
jgi:hypothetical protein